MSNNPPTSPAAGRVKTATYRVQLHPGFTLDDAAQLVDYLDRLGVSHLYSSPYLQAAPGSTHGYDVVNHHQVNHELGSAAAHRRLTQALQRRGLGQILDIVPNHMAATTENPWWMDVLENGQASPYASYFDVEWDPPAARHSNVVLAPVLGDHYGRVLEAGEIQLTYEQGRFAIRYYENAFPVDPRSLSSILAQAAEKSGSNTLAFLAGAFDRLPDAQATDRPSATRRDHDKAVLYALLGRLVKEQPEVDAAIRQAVEAINQDPDSLDVLIGLQNYRLAFWKMARRELGYRRFFDINTLIGLRIEDEQVFLDTHRLPLAWLSVGVLDGLRIDHPDGLRNPGEYFQRLRAASPEAWILIEKILEPGERLPEEWPVDGTTGYDFMNRVNGLFVDRTAERRLTEFYTQFTGRTSDYEALVLEKKRLVASTILRSDLNHLAALMIEVGERHRRYRDYPRGALRAALMEVAACLPVYRTYVVAETGEMHPTDVEYVNEAVAAAKANQPEIEPELFDFLADVLLLRVYGEVEAELVMRFQQFTGPVMAKGLEDTTFYNYYRLVSLNEVGGSPGQFGLPVEEFHRACEETQRRWAQSMLATSTHDSKRSEDVRARIDVLSEIPERWIEQVQQWSDLNAPYRTGETPDRNDEYLLYQTLVGAWPLETGRVLQYMEKAVREAKVHTSWTDPDAEYEAAMARFVLGALADEAFRASLEAFVAQVLRPGRINSLAQTLIKLTSPGVPDIYQGTELWDLSLVDPDNRRPVDYELRQRLLRGLTGDSRPEAVLEGLESGLPKLWVIRQALAVRRRHPELFGPQARYTPLPVTTGTVDPARLPAVAYLRSAGLGVAAEAEGPAAAVIVPHLTLRLKDAWDSTYVELPHGAWRNVLSQETLAGGPVSLAQLWGRFPVALLVRVEG